MKLSSTALFITNSTKEQLADKILDYKEDNPLAKGFFAIKDNQLVLVSKRSFLFNLSAIRQATQQLIEAQIAPKYSFCISFSQAFSAASKLFGNEAQQKLIMLAKTTIQLETLLTKQPIPYVLCGNQEEADKLENTNKIALWPSTSDTQAITIRIPGEAPKSVWREFEIVDTINSHLLAVSLQRHMVRDTPTKTAVSTIQANLKADANKSLSAASAWNDLAKYANEMKKQSWSTPKFNLFNDIRSNPKTRVHPDLSANFVRDQSGTKTLIAAAYPIEAALPTYLDMLFEQAPSVVFVLAQDKEIKSPFTPYFQAPLNVSDLDSSGMPICTSIPKNVTYGNIQTKSIHEPGKNILKNLSSHQYALTISKNGMQNPPIPVVHVTNWEDFSSGNGAPALLQLALAVEQFGGTPLIHCRAGVGRTGTLIVASMLLEQRRNGQTLTREGVVNLVKEVRAQRNEHMVQTEAQLKVLFDLVDLLNKTVA